MRNDVTPKLQANMQMKGGREQASVLCERSFLPCQMNVSGSEVSVAVHELKRLDVKWEVQSGKSEEGKENSKERALVIKKII